MTKITNTTNGNKDAILVVVAAYNESRRLLSCSCSHSSGADLLVNFDHLFFSKLTDRREESLYKTSLWRNLLAGRSVGMDVFTTEDISRTGSTQDAQQRQLITQMHTLIMKGFIRVVRDFSCASVSIIRSWNIFSGEDVYPM